jgi:hypothetical protein
MPKRHGLYRRPESGPSLTGRDSRPACLFGIFRVFVALAHGPLRDPVRDSLGATSKSPTGDVAIGLEAHCREYVRLLLAALDTLQRIQGDIAATGPFAKVQGWNLTIRLKLANEAVWSCLNVVIDDIARATDLALNHEKNEPIDGLSIVLNKDCKRLAGREPFYTLFSNLRRDPTSWWNLAFRPGSGIRQRLVHYPDQISVGLWQPAGADTFQVTATIHSFGKAEVRSGRQPEHVDVLAAVAEVLAKLCDWLDRLEDALVNELGRKCPDWASALWPQDPPFVPLPVEFPEQDRPIPEDFLYLPKAEGTGPIAGTLRPLSGSE